MFNAQVVLPMPGLPATIIRSPFLNHNLVNYANSISSSTKFSFKQGKLHLRAILERYLNKELINRPKKGFSIPIDEMIRL